MANQDQLTPLLRQYQEIKNNHRDAILFFRMGDFYEMFFDDAVPASKILEIVLTTRDKNYIASVYIGTVAGLAFVDISTGDFYIAEINPPVSPFTKGGTRISPFTKEETQIPYFTKG